MITSCWAKLFGGMALFSMACAGTIMAQVETPQTKGVYGGDIVYIAALSNSVDTTRLYVTAESANSAFYADVNFTQPAPFGTNLMFQSVPDLVAAANHGVPNCMAVHNASGRLFVNNTTEGLLSCTIASNSLVTNVSASVWGVAIEGSRLVYVRWEFGTLKLGYGTLSADGSTFTESGLPATIATELTGLWNVYLGVHPTNHTVYLSWQDNTNIVRSADGIENMSVDTIFTSLDLPDLTTNWTGRALTFGFGPDGRIFVGGYNSASTNTSQNSGGELTYSGNNGLTWSEAIPGGGGSPLWTTVGDPANYWVYNGSAVSTNKGLNWQTFGSQVPGSRVNGRVVADPSHPLVLYCDTEGGFGVCTNGGMTDDLDTIINISRGIEAATIDDFDLTADKNIAWIAANGIRRASNFQGTPEWSDPKWPMADGTCDYVAVDKSDTNGLTVYAGGTLLYKTTNGGQFETNVYNATNWTRVFNPTNYGFEVNAVSVSAIEANSNIVVVGLQGNITYTFKGALFLSTDAGSNWNQVVLHAGGVDIKDLLLTRENGADVVYAAVANTAYGVFRISIADATITHELTDTVNMQDLAVASDGSLYASGFDTQDNVVLYSKAAGAAEWTALPLDGYPPTKMAMYGGVPLVTVGLDASSNEVPYMLGAEWITGTNASGTRGAIFYMTTEGTNVAWETSDALRYPSGTLINVIFWDDLVVGTSFGLYGQLFQSELTVTTTALTADFDGDSLADPALYNTNGTWSLKLSSGGYTRLDLAGFLGGSGYSAVAADFDGDRLADPAVYQAATGTWKIKLSSSGYAVVPLENFLGGSGYVALAGDFDGDRLADPAVYQASTGTWKVKLSTAGYLEIPKPDFLGETGWTAISADFDGDRLVDPAVYQATTESWVVMLSSSGYSVYALDPHFLGGTDYTAFAGDFDNDGYADPAVAQTSTGNWKIKLSSGGYSLLDLPGFLGE